MGASDPVHLLVSIADTSSPDAESIDVETRRFAREVSDLDVESVEPARAGDIPRGAKGADVAAIGAVLVSLLPAALPKLIDFIQAWALRSSGRTVKIHATAGDRTFDLEYSPTTTSREELQELLAAVSRAMHGTNDSA
jgi:hypothetical protein